MGLDINKFLSKVTTDEKLFLNMPIFWTVSITGVSVGEINSVLQSAGEAWRANVDIQSMIDVNYGNLNDAKQFVSTILFLEGKI